MVTLKIKENSRKIIDCDNVYCKKKTWKESITANEENFDNCNREN